MVSTVHTYQSGILAAVPAQARYLNFQLAPQSNRKLTRQSLAALQTHIDGKHSVLGLGDAFVLVDEVDVFKHHTGRDLTGYLDGTENPKGKRV
jgi:deferrochelatase/peroxidase EfeB